MARWQQLPWVTCPLAFAFAVWVVAGKTTQVDLNLVANLGLSIAVPAGVVKIVWDRHQKRRQRKRISELEKENIELREQAAELRGQLQAGRERAGRG